MRITILALALAAGAAAPCLGAITMGGNVNGNPVAAPLNPCPDHAGAHCESRLNPTSVSLIGTPSPWFVGVMNAAYGAAP